MKGRRLWLKADAPGGTIPVYTQQAELLDDDGNPCEAYYDDAVPCIIVRHTGNIASMKQSLHHELFHVCIAKEPGESVNKALGTDAAGRAEREEDVVCFFEPKQYDLLTRNGWLKYPNPPRFR